MFAIAHTTLASGRRKRFSVCHVSISPLRIRHAAATSDSRSSGCVNSWSRRPTRSSGRAAEQHAQRSVGAQILALGVEDRHPDRRALEREVQQAPRLLDEQPGIELAQHDEAVAGATPVLVTLTSATNGTRSA